MRRRIVFSVAVLIAVLATPSRATPTRSSTLGSCTTPARAFSRIPCLRTCG